MNFTKNHSRKSPRETKSTLSASQSTRKNFYLHQINTRKSLATRQEWSGAVHLEKKSGRREPEHGTEVKRKEKIRRWILFYQSFIRVVCRFLFSSIFRPNNFVLPLQLLLFANYFLLILPAHEKCAMCTDKPPI